MEKWTINELEEYHFNYFGYHWCQTIISIGNLYGIENELEKLVSELKLNYHKNEFNHDLVVINCFLLITNPDDLTPEILYILFGEEFVDKYIKKQEWKNNTDGLAVLDILNCDIFHTLFIKKRECKYNSVSYLTGV